MVVRQRAIREIMMCFQVFLLLPIILINGCTKGTPPKNTHSEDPRGPGSASKQYRIAVIPKGTTHEFWKSVHYGAVQAAKELGNVTVLWKGAVLERDREGQIQVMQDFIVQRVDGICLAPLDSQALVEYVVEAREKGIPVVIFDSGLDREDIIVSYVATDNYHGGVLAAKRLAEVLGNRGNVILLRYNQGSESTYQREEGFLKTIQNDYPDLQVLSSEEYAGTTPEESLAKAQQVLQRYRDQVDGIFAVCEPNATGVLRALQELNLTGRVKFIAFDPNLPLINGLERGAVHGIILQDPVKMGYLAVKTMIDYLQGGSVPRRINTGEYVATPENMHEPQMLQLLNPPQFAD